MNTKRLFVKFLDIFLSDLSDFITKFKGLFKTKTKYYDKTRYHVEIQVIR